MKTAFITHPIFLQHETGPGHPESPRRLSAIQDHLVRSGLASHLELVDPLPRGDLSRWIGEIHRSTYYQWLRERTPKNGFVHLDPDTPYSPQSLMAAEMTVCGVLTAIDRVIEGTSKNAFCAVRPPGHHAEANRAMGFCIFNNVAVGARYLQKAHGLQRILIIDWDVHHGNGTQHSFYNDPTVYYFSSHQYPFYPGTGSEAERGMGEGEGFTLNCPLSTGAGDKEILAKFEKVMTPAVELFKPDFILISAGFDAHQDDPLAGLRVTDGGFRELTKIVQSWADRYCQGRVVSCLEGGYNLEALARSVGVHLEVLAEL